MNNIPKARYCKVCKTRFKPETIFQWWCCDDHKADYAVQLSNERREQRAKAQKRKLEKAQRAEWTERKAAVKPLSHWMNMTQRAFNDYIRARDAGCGCISCGSTTAVEYHAGHFRTTKAASQLRFNEDNCHLQCSACNVHHSGAISQYRINLIAKIGLERVLALENDNTSHRHTREELDDTRASYRSKLRSLKKLQEAA